MTQLCRRMALSFLLLMGSHQASAISASDAPAPVAAGHVSGITPESYARAEAVLPRNVSSLVRQMSVRPQWIGEGSAFWFVRDLAEGPQYVRVDAVARKMRPLFDHDALRAALSRATGRSVAARDLKLQGLAFDEAKKAFTFFFDKRQWTLDAATGAVAEKPADEGNAAVSPDGAWKVVVRDHDLYLVSVKTGEERRLTTDGTAEKPYARPVINVKRMIAAGTDKPDLEPYVAWSPDSGRFATFRLDLTKARRLSLVQSTPPDGSPPKVYNYVYTFTGDTETPRATGVIFSTDGKRTDIDMPATEILYYGGLWFRWSKDGEAVFRMIPERGYKALRLFRVEASSGKARLLTEDRADPYVDFYGHHWSYNEDTDTHFWTADPSGYAHIYAINGTTGERRQLTAGEWRARSVAGIDVKGGAALIVGSGRETGRDPYLRTLYRVSLKGGEPKLLTPEPLDHGVSVSPDGKYFVDNMSLINQPTRSVLRRSSDGAIVMELARADASAYLAAGYTFPEPFETVAADGQTKIYGAIYRPANVNPAGRYPVIEDMYTGPHHVMTPKSFEAAFNTHLNALTQLGFFGVTVDGRGTWGRSRAFQQVAYGNLHNVGLEDHVKAIRDMAARYPAMDVDRVGVFGFSAGGYDVMRSLTRRPDFYKAGVSASGNHDNRLDKATWNEQWMGTELGPVYDENSNMTWAKELKGKLFLAHGELDENVPPAATLRLVDALIKANKDFEFLIVPNGDHFLDESPYFVRKRWDFFLRSLRGVEPPKGYEVKPFPTGR